MDLGNATFAVGEEHQFLRRSDLFCDIAPGNWFLLWTKSRQEKIVADDLDARGIPNFLPLSTHVRYHGKQKAVVELALFPGYVFLRGLAEDAYALDRAGRIARIIEIADQKKVNWELKNLHFALTQDAPLSPHPWLQMGVRVEVRAGPLRGLQGIIESRTKRNHLILQIEIMGRAVSMEVDGSLLDVLD